MHKIAFIGEQCSGKTTFAKTARKTSEKSKIIKFAQPHYDVLTALKQSKNRPFMQEFSDLAKRHFGTDIFIDIFKKHFEIKEKDNDIEKHLLGEIYEPLQLIICDDIRYHKEMKMCKSKGFKIIYVDTPEIIRRERAEKLGLNFKPNHNSETEIKSLMEYANIVVSGEIKEQDRKYILNMIFNS